MKGIWILTLVLLLLHLPAFAQTTEFTYQGRLVDNSLPANGTYEMRFRLFDAVAGGTQMPQPTPITLEFTVANSNPVTVTNGSFTVNLDFGASAFPGAPRFLEASVRRVSSDPFTPLNPRQQITSTPHNIRSLSATTADALSANCALCVTNAQIQSIDGSKVTGTVANAVNASTATNATTATNAAQLGGVAANQYVQTGDPRMSDARNPLPNSSSYVQNNPPSQQVSSSFNISGNGIVGDTLSGNIVRATTQFNIGGNRILSNNGTDNLFAGLGAGVANTSGERNAFFGAGAGQANTGGSFNAFFGRNAGRANESGDLNAFFGTNAGQANMAGGDNAFFGTNAGANTIGSRNSFFGRSSGQANTGGNDNVFVGMFAGNSNATGSNNTVVGTSADLGAGNLDFATAIGAGSVVSSSNTIALGRSSGADTVRVPGALSVTGTISGNGSSLTNLNASNISTGLLGIGRGGTGLSTPGSAGTFLRSDGTNWTSSVLLAADIPGGSGNYIRNDGINTQAADFNIAGNGKVQGSLTASEFFIGPDRVLAVAGPISPTNTFVGVDAGDSNPTAGFNTFVGNGSGRATTTGENNSFFGSGSGNVNQIGRDNAFFGRNAGFANTTDDNSFFGSFAGASNSSGTRNAFFGKEAGRSNVAGFDNSFFGYLAGSSNIGGVSIGGNFNSFFGSNAGRSNNSGTGNSFFGNEAGANNTIGFHNAFFGYLAGRANIGDSGGGGNENAFFGVAAGIKNTQGGGNSFFGRSSGHENTTGLLNSFFGYGAGGSLATGDRNTALGAGAGIASGINDATAVGSRSYAGQSNSLVLGSIAGVNNSLITTKVGIGTTAPQYRLHVVDPSNAGLRVETGAFGGKVASFGGNGSFEIDSNGFVGGRFFVSEGGNVGIGTAAPTARLDINGSLNVRGLISGDFPSSGGNPLCVSITGEFITYCISSSRYKHNIHPFGSGLQLVHRLRPVTFNWNESGVLDMGLVAEEVAEVAPLLATYTKEGETNGVKYDRLGVILINAVKEQQAQIEAQSALLEQQKKRIEALEKIICAANTAAGICKQEK